MQEDFPGCAASTAPRSGCCAIRLALGAAAVPLAWVIVRAVTASLLFGRTSEKFLTLTPDAGVIAATALLTVCIGLAVGVVSAWQSVTVHVDESLLAGSHEADDSGQLIGFALRPPRPVPAFGDLLDRLVRLALREE